MKDFANASALAGQEVELEIPAKINDGVTRVNIPNTAKSATLIRTTTAVRKRLNR